MLRKLYVWIVILVCYLLGTGQSVLAFQVDGWVDFSRATQQFAVVLHLPDCDYGREQQHSILQGNLTQYITIPNVDRYTVHRRHTDRHTDRDQVTIQGTFHAYTTYTVTVDGAICRRPGTATATISTGAYASAIEFLSKGLYFSKIHPHLRFRHREVSTIHWTIHRIAKENRYLFSRTEGLKVSRLQTAGAGDSTTEAIDYFHYIDAYPGQRFTTRSRVQKSADWQVAALDLTPYYKEGDWLVVIASLPTTATEIPAAAAEEAPTEMEQEEAVETREYAYPGVEPHVSPLANTVVQFTNLGLYVRQNETGIWGQTMALDTGTPVFATVLFKQQNGGVLHRMDTDTHGWFRLPRGSLPSKASLQQLHRVEAVRGEDSVEVFLTSESIPLRSFPVTGVERKGPMQAFVYSDRGLYRLGENVHLTTLIRHWDLAVPQDDMTVELIIEGPTGRVKRVPLPGTALQDGAASWSWSIPDDANTGKYRAEVHRQGTVIGAGTFAIEQIIPPTIEAEVRLQEPYATWHAEQDQLSIVTGTVTARFLFGAPAAGKKWEYDCILEAGRFTPHQYEDFIFHDTLKVFPPQTFLHQENGKLDEHGKGEVTCASGQSLSLEMVRDTMPGVGSIKVVATVFEEGGRSVQTSRALPAYFHAVYPGIRPMSTGNLEWNQAASFQLVALDPTTGHPQAGVKLKVELYEKDYWGWYYFHRRSTPMVDAELTRRLHATEEVVSGTSPLLYSITPPGCCDWELVVSVAETSIASRVAFRNGYGWQSQAGPGAALAPKVTLLADKDVYTIGETATVLITAPFDGVLLLSHEKDGQPVHTDSVAVVNQTAEYRFVVTPAHVSWFRLNALLLRTVPTTSEGFQAKRETPYRALGMLPIQVRALDETLSFSIQAPPHVTPDSVLPLAIRAQESGGQTLSGPVWMTVAVVDEGILNLGRFATPDPYAGLHRRPAYTSAWFDTFGQVIPYSLHEGESAFGGDEELDLSGHVERVKPMAWWSGIVHTDATGMLTLDVPVHDYTGRVRVMVVGWQGKRTGAAQTQTLVFAPVDLLTSLPRVVGALDRTQAVAEVLNNTDSEQTVTVSCTTTGPLQLADVAEASMTLRIPPKQARVARWSVGGGGVPGNAQVTFVAQNADGQMRKRSTELFVRPLSTPITMVKPFLVRGEESHQTQLPDDLVFAPGTGQWEVTLSTSPATKIAKHLQYLVSYPHGCVEQTTSRLLAMLMLKPTLGVEVLSSYLDAKTVGNIDSFLAAGIHKLAKMQMADGGFTFWPGGSQQYSWLNAYVAHFLWKARQLGYAIPDELYTNALKKLQAQFTSSSPPDVIAYSAFVLALNGQMSKADLQRLVLLLQAVSPKQENVQLAAAYGLAQATLVRLDQPGQALAALYGLPEVTLDMPAAWWWRDPYHFLSREGAFAERLYTRALGNDASVASSILALLDSLAERSYLSTHDIAWTLLAVESAFSASPSAPKVTVTTSSGTTHNVSTARGTNQVMGSLPRGDKGLLTITNATPNSSLFGYVTYRGWPVRPPHEGFAQRLELHRVYLDAAGHVLTPPFTVKQGQRLFVMLLARHRVEDLAALPHVALEDWLPAGFELENLRLLEADALPPLPEAWRGTELWKPDYIDYLDDKIALFGTLRQTFQAFVFPVRAVSQGTFQVMPSTAEAMYMPDVRAFEVADGQITISAPSAP